MDFAAFRELCRQHRLAATHQRYVIYREVTARPGHYSAEEVYVAVRKQIPSVSLATIYKNLKAFVAAGLLRDLSPYHGSLRVDPNLHPHYHLVCTRCHSITDMDPQALPALELPRRLPGGFRPQRYAIEVLGLCARCKTKSSH